MAQDENNTGLIVSALSSPGYVFTEPGGLINQAPQKGSSVNILLISTLGFMALAMALFIGISAAAVVEHAKGR